MPTGEKPESKLWWNDGLWWGILWSTTGNAYHIYRLDLASQNWVDTGIAADDRNNSRADTLWDGQHLYVVSHIFSDKTGEPAPAGQRGELYRYSYDGGAKSYSLDPNYPVEVTDGNAEAMVVEKDSTGRLWVAYTEDQKVTVNHSLSGDDHAWGTPFVLPVTDATALSNDDIASLVAFNGQIGVMWSNQHTTKMYFAIHLDSAQDNVWQSTSIYAPGGAAADDHMNLKSLQTDNAGSVFAVVKTSFSADTDPLINLLVCASGSGCASASNWRPYLVYSKVDDHTRAILLIDTTNRTLNVFSTSPKFGGAIYRKSTSIDNIQFASGHGTPFIQSATDKTINNATSTKQNVNSTTGIVVLASDEKTDYYLHNYLSLGSPVTATVALSQASYTVIEASGTATITVNLSKALAAPATVNYATSNGTATAGKDYTARSGTLTFATGQTSQSFFVPIQEDSLDEPAETLNLTLSNPTNAVLGLPATATLTIMDNDNPPNVHFSSGNYTVDENGGAAIVTAQLSAASGMTITVNYTTSNGTALAGQDYTSSNGTLTFSPGQTSATLSVAILEDGLDENDETMNLALSNPANASLGAPASAVLTVLDNDNPPLVQFSQTNYRSSEHDGAATITVTLNSISEKVITVHYATNNGTATAGQDYVAASGELTFNPGQTLQQFSIPLLDDNGKESDETVKLGLSNPTNGSLGVANASLTIVDDDPPVRVQFGAAAYSVGEQSGPAILTVMLNYAVSVPVTVQYATGGGTALAGVDYTPTSGLLTFAPGEIKKNISIPLSADQLDEGTETVDVTLSDPSGNALLGAPSKTVLLITDGVSIPTVQFSASSYSTREAEGVATITVTLSAATDKLVTVGYATTDGTALAGSDYTAANAQLTFNPGETSKTFKLTITNDALNEDDETIKLVLSNPTNAILGIATDATLTVLDDDAPPIIQFSTEDYVYGLSNSGSEVAITVELSAASGKPVTVNYAIARNRVPAGENPVTSGTLTFNPGEISKAFRVPILPDDLTTPNQTITLTLSNPTNASVGTPTAMLTFAETNQNLLYLPIVIH